MIPSFVVRSLDGRATAYTEDGKPLDLPTVVVEAWAEVPAIQVIAMLPEPSQAENVIAQNEMDRMLRQGCSCDLTGWIVARHSHLAGMRFHRSECPVSVAYQKARQEKEARP